MTRRRALGGGAAALVTALSGCSSLPLGDEEEPQLGFDPEGLPQSVVSNLPERPSVYPGAVPDRLTDQHRERAQTLLDDVPAEPSFPNGKMSGRLAAERELAVETLREGSDAEPTPLARLGHWRYIRGTVADVWGACHAAAEDIETATFESRREEIRRDLLAFEAEWSYPGPNSVAALAVNNQFEQLRTACRRHLAPRWNFPDDPTASVFRVGSLVAGLERARAELDDLTGLHDAYRESISASAAGYRTEFSVLAPRLDEIISVSRKQVAPISMRMRTRRISIEISSGCQRPNCSRDYSGSLSAASTTPRRNATAATTLGPSYMPGRPSSRLSRCRPQYVRYGTENTGCLRLFQR